MKLYRPPIPVEVRCRVALAQLGEIWPEGRLDAWRYDRTVAPRYRNPGLGKLLEILLAELAGLLGCAKIELRLDHNPALGLRKKRTRRELKYHPPTDGIVALMVTTYTPDANDPAYLIYRSHAAHHIKTNVKGDGAQFSDTVLMKRERRRRRKALLKKVAGKKVGFLTTLSGKPRKFKWPKGRKLQGGNNLKRGRP